jgi:hypothetical protein
VVVVDDELDDHDLWEAAVATAPIPLMSRTDRRAAAAVDLAARQSRQIQEVA